MDSGARYSALEHGGLELAPNTAPEVYAPDTGNESKEVVPGSSPPLERRRSTDAAEVTHPGQYEQQEPHPEEHSVAPYYAGDNKGYYGGAAAVPVTEGEKLGNDKAGRRYCGMKRGLFFIVLGIIAFIVILAAVLGGVLGTVLPKNNKSHTANNNGGINSGDNNGGDNSTDSNNSTSISNTTSVPDAPPVQAMTNSGLAAAVVSSGTGRLLLYYQDENGRIIENSYLNDTWTLEDSSNLENSVVVSSGVQAGSPLAAITYEINGLNARQVFFLNASGLLHETQSIVNKAGIGVQWSTPSLVFTQAASPNSMSIAACASTGPMNGTRVYLGTEDITNGAYIQEIGLDFGGNAWQLDTKFFGADPDSGISCGIWSAPDLSYQYLDLYFRNTSTSAVTQNSWNYVGNNTSWFLGPIAPDDLAIPQGGDIAVVEDPGDNEYVHWPLANGTIVRGYFNPVSPTTVFGGTILEAQIAGSGSKLASTWTSDGAVLFYQNGTNASNIYMSTISRNGALIADVVVV